MWTPAMSSGLKTLVMKRDTASIVSIIAPDTEPEPVYSWAASSMVLPVTLVARIVEVTM